MKHIDLFSGIGGFALATEMVWDNVEHIFCDNEPYAQQVLKKHWPNSPCIDDIRRFTLNTLCGEHRTEYGTIRETQEIQGVSRETLDSWGVSGTVDLLTGGFPCQPFSQAGRRRGTEDDRHLWPEMLRVIQEFHPRWVIGENVGGFVTWSGGLVLEQVHTDLESESYEVQAFIIPAVSLNAPHRRDRVWIVAHTKSDGSGRRPEEICKENGGQDSKLHTESNNTNSSNAPDSRQQHGKQGRNEGVEANTKKRTARTTDFKRQDKDGGYVANTKRKRQQGQRNNGESSNSEENQNGQTNRFDYSHNWSENWLEVATKLCRVDDGIPSRLDRTPRLKGLGNAIVPQVAAEIMKVIKQIDEARNF